MRVIAGTAGGLRLDCPDGIARPMMDRVRGAVFSSLGEVVPGARALDLFAGSGAIGIEALSRGAASCVFVDQNRKAAGIIRANLAHARLPGTVRGQDVAAFVARADPASFDLVFADPPFALDPAAPAHPATLLAGHHLARCVAPDGLFVIELPARPPEGNASWALLHHRRYGQAWVAFYRRTPDA
ncbi:MAG: 16S rRNA (guanine(966)-N(2))-methyltransferase RsmD [Chthoniobacterales bacterium]